MKQPANVDGPQGNSVVDEVAAATTDVAGEVLGVVAPPPRRGRPTICPAAEGRRPQVRRPAQRARHHPLRPARRPQRQRGRPSRREDGRLPRPPRPRPRRRAGRLSRPRRHRRVRGEVRQIGSGRRSGLFHLPSIPFVLCLISEAKSLSILRPSMSTISNRQPPIGEALADLGDMLEHRQREAGRGRIIAVLGQADAEPVGQRVGRERARHPPAAVVALDQWRIAAARNPPSEGTPASAVSRSPGVTIPSKWPYSSWTKAIGTSASRSTVNASIASIWSGTIGAARISARRSSGRPSSRRPTTSRAWTTPTSVSTEPSATGMRLCEASSSRARIVSWSPSTSIQSTSVRGVITSRDRPVGEPDDAGDRSPLIFLEHAGAVRLGDDEVELLGGDLILGFAAHPQQAEDEAAGAVEQPGEAASSIRDSQRIGSAATTAIGSGERRANCLGTSSPITSEA